jgi:hypothetical protein
LKQSAGGDTIQQDVAPKACFGICDICYDPYTLNPAPDKMLDEDTKWFAVSLRITGDALDPTQLESLLGLKPDILGIRGQPRHGKHGRLYAPYETNLWSYQEGVSSGICFGQRIHSLFERLGDRVSELRRLSATDGVDVELFCGFSSGNGQGGDTLRPETLKLIVDAGLSVTLDLYPPDVCIEDMAK